ncbi:MAG: response regulator, partial [Deltaproteobacteria bacterium]
PDERQRFLTILQEQQGISGFSAEIRTFEGKSRTVLLYSNFVNYSGEHCIFSLFLDVTEQKLMEDQLRQTQKMDVIGQLAGGVAHDFNNMLTAIIGSAELMERHVKHAPAPMKLLGNILEASARSADLTQQLLAFSRKEQKNSTQVCIHKTINAVISLLERTVDKKISLVTRLEAETDVVIGDLTFLQNALLNLGINARDAMPEGGILTFTTAIVELDSSSRMSHAFNVLPGQFLEISVFDTGLGMTREVVERIFEPFFTTKEVGKGTGLGLAAVYNPVKEHNGNINVFSEAGIGTVFKIYLPSHVGEGAVLNASTELSRGIGGILLVDDEPLIRNMGRELLQNVGYQVLLAEDGEQALEVYAREKEDISLVILDVVMPKMGGKETLERLMANDPDVRVLITSGFHQDGTADTLMNLGAKGFIPKPYSQLGLCKAVAEIIGYENC